MAGDSDKNWNRPWTTEEIIEKADNWSLAGDAALLNSIKAYADKLLTKTVSLSENVDEMLNNINEASLRLDISQNEFQSLRNTQFIESRVYEDDETLEENITETAKGEETQPTEEENEQTLKNAILEGLEIMNKYFDKIEVSISDSEEEEDEKSDKNYMLKAKDFYADRLLPLVIGTEEWYKKWHVGLIESSSDSESEKTEIYSESDSENDLPEDLMKGSETSSELDFSSQASENRPVANSTFNDSTKKPDIFASSDESDTQGSLPVKTPISNKTFAEQLAARLGNVINEQEDLSTQINRRPIQSVQTSKYIGDLFSDEPPPLDDLEETILPKSAQSGLFSGGQGLFDDNEDELFWGQQNQVPKTTAENEQIKEEVKTPTQNIPKIVNSVPKSSHISRGLFDSDDSSSDDDMFASKRQPKPPYLQPHKTLPPLFAEEPPELEDPKKATEEEATKKKPIGGVSIFGTTNIFGDQKIDSILKPQQQDREESVPTNEKNKTVDNKLKKIDLFDDDSDAVTQANDNKSKKTGLFDEDVDSTPTKSRDKKFSLFDDDTDSVSSKTNNNPKKAGLFDDDIDNISQTEPAAKSQTKKISLFDDDDDLFKDDLFSSVVAKKPNLFDDIENDSESFINNNTPKLDLFSDLDNVKVESMDKSVKEEQNESESFNKKTEAIDVENNNSINIDTAKESENIVQHDVISTKSESGKEEITDANKTNENISERRVIGAELRVEEDVSAQLTSKSSKGLFEDDNEDDGMFRDDGIAKKTELFDDLFAKNSVITPPKTTVGAKPDVPHLQVTNPTPESSNASKKIQERSPIDLFSSTPPPVDDEWDTKSDFSDNDDLLPSYRVDDNTGQFSIFDNEPPSLGPNESSGIVRDYNRTRLDTADDSSFYPYASSSRRFSSDIFNDQQSQDSFYVTKNKTESVNTPSNLGIIPEDTNASHLSITPSGRMEDFDTSNDDSEAIDNSVFIDNTKTQPKVSNVAKKPVSLFDDYDVTSDSGDLFSSKVPKLPEKPTPSLFENLQDSSIPEKTDEVIRETCNTPEAKDTKSKIASIAERLQNEFEKEPPKTPTDSPKKLKHNLNINVNALLPGYASPKLKELTKSSSLDIPKEQEGSLNISMPDVSLHTPDLSRREKHDDPEKAVSFEDALDNVEVLHSVTKDRARIPIKRRPSTRRGRQEAIRKSVADFTLEKEKNDDATQENKSDVINKPVEDVKVPELRKEQPEHFVGKDETVSLKTKDAQEPKGIEIPKERPTSLFDKVGSDDEELFPNLAKKIKNSGKGDKSGNSIFDSGDSDSDLFGATEHTKSNKVKQSEVVVKKSLFNDSSSDDDLFAGSTTNDVRKKEPVHKKDKKVQKKSTLRKLENIEADDDPLSSLLK